MHDRDCPGRWSFIPALLLIAGCAQQSYPATSGPLYTNTDHWVTDTKYKNSGVSTPSGDASIGIGCTAIDPSVAVLMQPTSPMSLKPAYRTVTIIVDSETPFDQSWFSSPREYGISDDESGFSDLVKKLKGHQNVEIVLRDSGKELDHHSFTLTGAAEGIDSTLAACGHKPIP